MDGGSPSRLSRSVSVSYTSSPELNGPVEQPMGRNSSSVSMSGSSLLYVVLARTGGSSLASSVCLMSRGLAGMAGLSLLVILSVWDHAFLSPCDISF